MTPHPAPGALDGTDVDVAVVGAGFAGLGTAIRLQREGAASYVVLERGDDVGGTWRDNTYPGVACDIPSHLYSYSFRPPSRWSRRFAPGAEILEYLRTSAREEDVLAHVHLRTDVLDARWDESTERWQVSTSRGTCTARALVLAAGRLHEPRLPDVAGSASFAGRAFHSARWPTGLRAGDLAGARVGIVGTGASAAQILPEVAAVAREVVVVQRSAPWVLPREDRPVDEAEAAALADDPAAYERVRAELFAAAEEGHQARTGDPAAVAGVRSAALDHLRSQVPDPALRRALVPDYEIGCKRIVFSDDYYPALARPNVRLETRPLRAVVPDGIVVGDDDPTATEATQLATHGLDVIVWATGFRSTRPPYARGVHGRGGLRLDEAWSDGMRSFASTVVHGFPNLFVLNGPHATLGHNSAIVMIEAQVDYVLGALAHLRAHGGTLDVPLEAQEAYTQEMDSRLASMVWATGGCTSWYRDEETGRVTLVWPGTGTQFRERNARFDPAVFQAGLQRAASTATSPTSGRQGSRFHVALSGAPRA
ncbi:flavin-containing monooxygenase [Oerskovia flava]|uniref:flavin-containing monooxygenase n=1 Tax=Oerskovia flava TaxID=2986422 RepID=UPI00224016A9|nr:NAD(P)/FAD-dependent oxidoreductase [Oerskovia sp. JB1-3-2]